MALAAKYDSEEAIPEGLREHYAERNGAWHLTLDGVPSGLVEAARLNEFRDNNRQLHKELESLRESEALLNKRLTDRHESPPKSSDTPPKDDDPVTGEIAALREALKKQSEALAKLSTEREAEQAERAAERAEQNLRAALEAEMGNHFTDGALRLAMHDAKARGYGWSEDRAIRMDGNGNPVYSSDTGEPETLKDFVTAFRAEYPTLVKPSSGSQSNAGGPNRSTVFPNAGYPKKRGEFTPEQTIAYIKEHGREQYTGLPA